ncbi:MAG: carbamoyltransferase C-terminal domain-containing protein [Thalassospira sp.]|uniref:carbamoyltransferase C-terminal domain-containing protein n=1 Tax=Thalassospira sp. TaxID=1912094 RepID=UPI0032EAA9F5
MIIASIYPCPFDPQVRHDLNAAIVMGDEIYAYEEDKLTSVKNEPTSCFPERSLMMGCKEFGIVPAEVDIWVLPTPRETPRLDNLFTFFAGLIKAYEGSFTDFEGWYKARVHFVDHQLSHAALAAYGSGFEDCTFVSQDGGGDMGDPRNMIFGEFKGGVFEIYGEASGLQNVCSFHAFVTDACGFGGGENGKTSGLASYGQVRSDLKEKMRSLISLEGDGIVFKRERYSRTPVNIEKVKPQEYNRDKIFLRVPSDTNIFNLTCKYLPQDVAATGESLMQEVFLEFLTNVKNRIGNKRVVLSGGLFQNVALNRVIAESGLFEDYYFPMAPSDGGLALGAALKVRDQIVRDQSYGSTRGLLANTPLTAFIGPSFAASEIEQLLRRFRLFYTRVVNPAEEAGKLLAAGKVVGWFQGRAEFGPRSLGARSILADPRTNGSKFRVNQRLKRRDWFMPYAPSILEEEFEDWVEKPLYSPYMQIAFRVTEENARKIPAAVHVDGSSRMNVVRRSDNAAYWSLINSFYRETGIPMVLNTSFNRHGIATISSPRQAIEHLLEGCMDSLVIEDFVIHFAENRIADDHDEEISSEETLLIEDCLRWIKVLAAQKDESVIDHYIEHLSELLGVQVTRNVNKILIPGRGPIKISD